MPRSLLARTKGTSGWRNFVGGDSLIEATGFLPDTDIEIDIGTGEIFTIRTLPEFNTAPRVTSPIRGYTMIVGSPTTSFDLSQNFSGATSYMLARPVSGITLTGSVLVISPMVIVASDVTVIARNDNGETAQSTFSYVVNAASPTVTRMISDVTLQVNDIFTPINLAGYFANASRYEVNPVGQGVTVSGSSLSINTSIARNVTYIVTAINSTGQAISSNFNLTVLTPIVEMKINMTADGVEIVDPTPLNIMNIEASSDGIIATKQV